MAAIFAKEATDSAPNTDSARSSENLNLLKMCAPEIATLPPSTCCDSLMKWYKKCSDCDWGFPGRSSSLSCPLPTPAARPPSPSSLPPRLLLLPFLFHSGTFSELSTVTGTSQVAGVWWLRVRRVTSEFHWLATFPHLILASSLLSKGGVFMDFSNVAFFPLIFATGIMTHYIPKFMTWSFFQCPLYLGIIRHK